MRDSRACRGNAVTLHEPFRKDLARLEPTSRAVGAEDRNAGVAQTVADAGGDRRLRPEHRKVDRSSRQRFASVLPSVAAISQFSPRDAVPALPGAANIASHDGDSASRHESASSRAPLPTTRTRIVYSHSTVAGGFVVMS